MRRCELAAVLSQQRLRDVSHRRARLLQLRSHEAEHFGDDEHVDRLSLGDATHAEATLRVVSEGHILAKRHQRLSVEPDPAWVETNPIKKLVHRCLV